MTTTKQGPKPNLRYYASRGLKSAVKLAKTTGRVANASYQGTKRAYSSAKSRYETSRERLLAREEALTEKRLAKAERVAALRAKQTRIKRLKATTPKKRLSYGRTYNPFGNDAILGGGTSSKKSTGNKQKDYDYSPFKF